MTCLRGPSKMAAVKPGSLSVAALSCLALAAGACDRKMSLKEAQVAFHDFSHCTVVEDFRGLKFKDAWVQTVVAAQGSSGGAGQRASGDSRGAAAQEYVVTVKDLQLNKTEAQAVVTAQTPPGGTGGANDSSSEPGYIVTGMIRNVPAGGSARDSVAVLLVRKVLDKYKVVRWATDLDPVGQKSLQPLSGQSPTIPYRGRCSWDG